MFNIETVVGICGICYLVGLIGKALPFMKDNYIPILVGVVGGLLGALGMTVIPGFPAENIIDAIAVGIASGLASTGANQVYKQLQKTEVGD